MAKLSNSSIRFNTPLSTNGSRYTELFRMTSKLGISRTLFGMIKENAEKYQIGMVLANYLNQKKIYFQPISINPLMLTAAKTSLTILKKSFRFLHNWQNI